MNELTLDGKLYISSKRAAEITGYAKDYVGQLCREGRVEARLVGRNWYVLNDAIQGKQFGSIDKNDEDKRQEIQGISLRRDTDQIAKYETQDSTDFPMVVHRIAEEPLPPEDKPYIDEERATDLAETQPSETWDSWFSPPTDPEPLISSTIEPEIEPEEVHQEKEKPAEEVSLRRIREYEPVQGAQEVVLEVNSRVQSYPRRQGGSRNHKIWLYTGLEIACVLIVLGAIAVAGVGSGFYQSPIFKTQANVLSGISFYTKH
ncbi:MAG: hypothetical protein ACREGR_02775 [Minisyncoccia bacterium]